ncbi:MAG: NAD-dependent epimerase, partial [Schleiferiaceae bacterium]
MSGTILILGACGQIGTELTLALRDKYGTDQIVASDIRRSDLAELQDGPFEIL